MKNYLKSLSALMSVLLLLPLFGCGGSGEITTAEEDTTAPEQTPAPVETTLIPETTQEPAPADEWTALREKANGEGIKVLFIGDSLTHYNEMPQIFAALCRAAGKKVLTAVIEQDVDPQQYCEENALDAQTDTSLIAAVIDKAIEANPQAVADYRAGKVKALQAVFGACMRELRGNGDPSVIRALLEEKMNG